MLNEINYDILLEYLSYIKSGTIEQFKRYIDNLDYDDKLKENKYNCYTIIASMFSRLGHVEFDYKKRIFAVCPPTLVLLANSKDGILSGYRTRHILNKIKDNFDADFVEIENYIAPKCITIKNIKDSLEKFSKIFPETELQISENFSNNVLGIVPTIKEYEKAIKNYKREYSPFLNEKGYFYDTKKLTFKKYQDDSYKDGLYEEKGRGYKYYYFYKNGNWYEKIDRQYGIFLALKNAKESVLKYSKNSLSIRNKVRLPELIDRALTMYSGMNPKTINGYKKYDNIELSTVKKVADILEQNIKSGE